MDLERLTSRFDQAQEPHGDVTRVLTLGDWCFRLTGLDTAMAEALDARWGGFLSTDEPAVGTPEIRLRRSGEDKPWLRARRGETYRIEAEQVNGRVLVVSYAFCLCRDEPGVWTVALTPLEREPLGRSLENAVRYVVAEAAVDAGGFAIHGAGVIDEGKAVIFAGGSNAGKTTAVELSAPRPSLGDDYALIAPGRDGWVTAAVPFDNAERAPAEPRRGWIPIRGVWRLYKDEVDKAERAPVTLAGASLMSCVALPWVMPHRVEALMGNVDTFVAEGAYGHLRFRKSDEFWQKIGPKREGKRSGRKSGKKAAKQA